MLLKKKTPNNMRKASKDPTSLGNILVECKIITETQLDRAIVFQRDNPDTMLGEALVRMNVLKRDMLEALLLKQSAVRRESRNSVSQFVELATQRTNETTQDMKGLRDYVAATLMDK